MWQVGFIFIRLHNNSSNIVCKIYHINCIVRNTNDTHCTIQNNNTGKTVINISRAITICSSLTSTRIWTWASITYLSNIPMQNMAGNFQIPRFALVGFALLLCRPFKGVADPRWSFGDGFCLYSRGVHKKVNISDHGGTPFLGVLWPKNTRVKKKRFDCSCIPV